MKYVDEFRDRELAEGLAKAIRHEASATRHYNVMEFCGGHTHAIFRYGVQDLDAGKRRLCAWPRLPGLRPAHRPHRQCDRTRGTARRHPLQLWRHAARSRLQAPQPVEGEGGRRRHPHGLFHRRRAEDRAPEPEPRGGLLRHRLRDDDAANGGRHPEGARRRASRISRFFAIMC